MKATVGRIVHYTNLGDKDGKYPPEQQAAIVTRVRDDDKVCLHIKAGHLCKACGSWIPFEFHGTYCPLRTFQERAKEE